MISHWGPCFDFVPKSDGVVALSRTEGRWQKDAATKLKAPLRAFATQGSNGILASLSSSSARCTARRGSRFVCHRFDFQPELKGDLEHLPRLWCPVSLGRGPLQSTKKRCPSSHGRVWTQRFVEWVRIWWSKPSWKRWSPT